jgi:hypothetical protein
VRRRRPVRRPRGAAPTVTLSATDVTDVTNGIPGTGTPGTDRAGTPGTDLAGIPGTDRAGTPGVVPIPTASAGRSPAAAVPPTSKEWPS